MMRGLLLALLLLAVPSLAFAQTGTRYVNPTDPTCGGHSPCSTSLQAAVSTALPGERIVLQAGTYHKQLSITGKNNTASASEADRIVIEADPLAPLGSVVLTPPTSQCTPGHAVRFQQSKFVTLRGLTITGAGGQAVSLMGGNNQNQAIHLERLRIVGNGSPECDGGITIARGNPDTLILNSVIYGNGRNGVTTIDADGGPHYLIGNTIHGNAWSGVNVSRNHNIFLVNNLITGNGTAAGSTGGRYGVTREASTTPNRAGIHLLNNLICGNRLGEINGPALDATDAGNLTPTGSEGLGVSASPGCEVAANVYAHLAGPDGLPNTVDDDFRLAPGSPALDRGMDPRTLGLSSAFTPLLETDFTGLPGARPKNATGAPTIRFDMGAFEANPLDQQAPVVTFLQPAAGAYVRGTVTVKAQATDSGSGVATFTLSADSQALVATLVPSLPPAAPSVTATATWATTAVADGTHTLSADATDDAGNPATATPTVIVDNTPPDTFITGAPPAEVNVPAVTISFSGADTLTPVASLQFAWRLVGETFSPFRSATTATLNLPEGQHTFEVKALDLAGNEDPTPAAVTFTVRFGPSITNVKPASGTLGTYVTITGTNFEPGTTQVSFNGLAAVVRTVTATQITTTVPIGATRGPLTVTTSRGSASAAFTVETTGDFTLAAAPPSVSAIAGDQTSVNIAAGGTGSFTSLVSLTVSTPPTGISASFSPSGFVAPGASAFVNLALASTVAPGTYNFTVTGQAQVDGRTVARTAAFTLEVLAPDTPAITGRVLTAEAVPKPIPGAEVKLASAFTRTDAGGNFVLLAPPAGPNMLRVDGPTASTPTAQYPPVEVNIAVNASGPTRVPFIVYLPVLDTANPVTLPLDVDGFTTREVKASTPVIPGLVVTIPAGTRIVDPDGVPVSQITITPVPTDRSPMPFPSGVIAPMLFTIQPGGAVPSQPLPITFPNIQNAPPGTPADLYFFDLIAGNWAVWGTGRVSDDGTRVVSDQGFGLRRFAWHFPWCRTAPPDDTRARHAKGGEPVDLVTGRFTVSKTDFVLPGRMPVSLQRHYRNENPQPGLFGIGWNLDLYDSRLTTAGTSLSLILPDQSSYLLASTGPGRWENATEPFLRGAVLTQLPGDFRFQLRLKEGTVHRFERLLGFANAAALAAITDRNGNTVTIGRVPTPFQDHRIISLTEPAGRAVTFAYDAAGRIASLTDPIGRIVQYGYDALGRLSTVTDPAGGITRYTYDAQHRLLTIADPRNITFLTNQYDADGRVIRQTQADGGVWTFAYTLTGSLVTQTVVTDPRGNPTTYRFTTEGFTAAITDALGQTTVNNYAPGSNLLAATTDPLGRTTRFTYDVQGNVTSIADPAGNQRTFTYEPTFNKIASITDPLANVTRFEYDALGNLTATVDPLGHRFTIGYNSAGQRISAADPLGNTARFEYDTVGQLVAVVDPLGKRTTLIYDGASRLTRQLDPRGKPTTLAYDALNRVTGITDALGGVMRLEYDANGNFLAVTDPHGHTTIHTYDTMNRLASRTDPVGAAESLEYDGRGNLMRHVDRKGQVATFNYDPLNRRTGATYVDSAITFVYDAGGRLLQAVDAAAGILLNAYNELDRLTAQTTAHGAMSYQYDSLGRRTAMTAPGRPPVTYAYDVASRLVSITEATQVIELTYDALSRRTRLTLPDKVSVDYQYDAAARLVAVTYQTALGPLGDLTYQYDPAGNRTRVGGSFARTLLPDPITGASYDAANRQLTFGARVLVYDANGNLVSDGATLYAWDARNRLVGLAGPGTTAALLYDILGRRIRTTVNAVVTDFVYDGLNPVLELSETNGAASTLTGGGIDEYFTRTDAAGRRTLLTDALGSILALIDADGTLQNQYTYEPFGVTASTGAPSTNRFQFTGREHDGTGLYYYRARYYHPELKRFLSEDPLGFEGGDLNLYAYVGNNPVTAADALGLWKPWAHDDITREAIKRVGGIGRRDADAIVAGNRAMDAWWTPVAWWNLVAVLNPLDASHSMPRSDPAESNRIVQQRLRDAICHEQAGEHQAALYILGQALHTAQDAWAHRYGPVRGGMTEHGRARVGLGADPDLPATNPAGYKSAIQETERILRDFQQGQGCKP